MIYFSDVHDQILDKGHIGNKMMTAPAHHVYFAQADGDELDVAMKMFPEIKPNKRVFTYCGVYAQMLYENWK